MITIRNHIELLPVFLLLFSPAVVCQEISILPPWYQHNPTLLTNAAADTTPPSSDTLFQILGRWGYGYSYTSKVHGKYAYIGNGASFQIVDITIPNSIQIVGELIIDGIVNNIQISEDYAFVCTGSGLLIIDISLKDRPEKVCFVPLPGGTTKAVVKNKLVYVFSLFGGLKIVDVSIPIQPFIRGSINLIEFPSTLSVADGYVYVGSTEFPGIEVIDATDPDNLISFMYIDVGGVPYSSYLRDTLLFVGTQEDLVILNISEPNSPTLVNTFNFGTQIGAIIGQDSMLYITSSYSNRIYSIDISQTSLPTVKDTLDLFPPGYGLDIDYASPNVIASQYTGVWLINASNSDSLQKASYIPTGGNAQNIFVQNGFAYIASGYSGLWMIDFTEPQKPVSLWNINVGGYTSDVFVKDHFALFVNSPGLLVNDSSRGLWIIDISNPQVPNLISHYTGIIRHSSIWAPPVITVSGDLAFITQAPDGTDSTLEIIDISDPLTPTRKAVHQSPFIPYHITTSDSIAYVATADGGLRVIDWHNPTLPIELPSFNNSTVYSTIGVTSSGKTIFADRVDTFFILDATNPSALNVIGKFGRSYGSYSSIDLAVTDGRVYWADGKLGVVDITDLNSPRELALFPGYGSGSGVDVKGDT
ncbi:MAG TPA: hypothetical protein VI932_08685, partial [Bacteroidota bacterium]|nr:hypothetical protein [Bacteroidota bacterium]